MSKSFVRARSSEQKSARHHQFLEAARVTVLEKGAEAATMAEIAKAAQIAPSAFYRYFKSKEEILAHLLIAEADQVTKELRVRLSDCRSFSELPAHFAQIFSSRPMFCDLTSDLARTLERNIALERLVIIKREFGRLLGEWTDLLIEFGLVQHPATAQQFIRTAYVMLCGLWPLTQERPLVLQAAEDAGLTHTFGAFQVEFQTLLGQLVRGLDERADL